MRAFSIALFGLALVVAATATEPNQTEWNSYKLKYSKKYKTSAEEMAAKKNFENNLKAINEHNELFKKGKFSYEQGLNEFSDLSNEEFQLKMHGNIPAHVKTSSRIISHLKSKVPQAADAIPSSIDWRTKGAVTAVKNQGQCNSCWAFASCGALEAAYFQKTGKLVELSVQNLVDCIHPDTNQCHMGNYQDAYDFIKKNGGIDTFASYPYSAKQGKCRQGKGNSGATVSRYVALPNGDEAALTKAVATIGPVTVEVNITLLNNYKGGVFNDPKCSQDVNHVVLIVGYGTDPKDGDFYIAKNSWGTTWGEQGFFKIARNKNNLCGVASWPGYPVI